MTLLDTNVLIYASDERAQLCRWVRRKAESGKDAPAVPLPDFFIGAHAQVMGWTLATADADRFKTYFPAVPLKTP